MRRPEGVGFLANSFANLLVGVAAVGYAVVVPAVVVRRFGAEQYGTWFLAFQIAAYVLLLDLGSQTVVSREAADRPPADGEAARLTTAAMASQLGLAGAVVALAAVWAAVAGQSDLARFVVILGGAAVASLLASTVRAWFGGLQRAHVPAVWLIAARAAALVGLFLALLADAGLVALSVAVAAPQLLVHAGLLAWARRDPSPWARPTRSTFARLFRASAPLAVWTVSGIVIAGVDVFTVRALDPAELGRYAIALPLMTLPIGVVTAAVTAWIPRVAAVGAGGPGRRDMTLAATTVVATALSMGAIVFVAFAHELVELWAGPGAWGRAGTYLQILYVASCLRFVFLPWSVLVITRGEQASITFAPVAEAVVNLGASVALGVWLGALGVALGTFVGALTAAVLYVVRAVPRTAGSGVTSPLLLRAAAAAWPPVAATTGACVLALLDAPVALRVLAAAVALLVGAWRLAPHARGVPVTVA